MLAQAMEAEVDAFRCALCPVQDGLSRRQIARTGYLPERTMQSGIAEIAIKAPRARNPSGSGIRFSSAILPPYLPCTGSIEELLPCLYLKSFSLGRFRHLMQPVPV